MKKMMTSRMGRSSSVYSNAKRQWVEFKDGRRYFFRSGWEVKYANYLEMVSKSKEVSHWTYEEDTFWFEAIRRGVRSYTPDFKIYFVDGTHHYHEVKGWMDSKSKTKLKRMAKYHPKETVIVIAEKEMKQLGLI